MPTFLLHPPPTRQVPAAAAATLARPIWVGGRDAAGRNPTPTPPPRFALIRGAFRMAPGDSGAVTGAAARERANGDQIVTDALLSPSRSAGILPPPPPASGSTFLVITAKPSPNWKAKLVTEANQLRGNASKLLGA